jgi:hypothetical protein
LRSI